MKSIGIIGAGAMGSGIAQVAAQAGVEVILWDQNSEALQKAQKNHIYFINRLAEKGKISNQDTQAIIGRIYYVNGINAMRDTDLVLEAIIENLSIKQGLFKQLEEIVSSDTVLASNTSSLSITEIAAGCKHPERVIGIHFFNPAPLMPLVEIIPAVQTKKSLPKQVFNEIKSWGKKTVLTKDTPGFIVNRVARPFYSEALRIFEEGLADQSTIDFAMTELGNFRMGPFTLMDFIGHDVNYKVTESMYRSFFEEPRYKPSFSQLRLVQAGYLGKKSGRGFYTYGDESKPEPSKNPILIETIFDRILAMLINEAADAVFWDIGSAEEIDTAMTKGVNYPKGLLQWADEIGIKKIVDRLDKLYHLYHEPRYRVSPILRKMDREHTTFY